MKPKLRSSGVIERLPPGARVAVIRLRSLGDCVLTTPAIELLKDFRPDLRLGVAVEFRFRAVFAGNPKIDEILPPTGSGLFRFSPSLAINLHGGTRSALLTLASRAPWRAGFGHFRFQPVYNIRIPRAQEILGLDRAVHTVEHLASAMFFLGVHQQPIGAARIFAEPFRAARAYAVIHPKASVPEKAWPARRYLEVAEFMRRELQLDPVFIAGPGESLAEFHSFECRSGADLQEVKKLLAGAALFAGNDSGPAHMAAAFGVPSVVLFGASDPDTWAPWKTEARLLRSPGGIGAISVSDVAEACASMALAHPR